MPKVEPISTNNNVFRQFSPKKVENKNILPSKSDNLIRNSLACIAALGVATLVVANRRNFKFSSAKKLLGRELYANFKSQMKEFPEDIKFRKTLLKSLGLPNSDVTILRPIVGNGEYRKIVSEFADSPIHYTPGNNIINKAQDAYEPIGATNKTFRISLHNHTIHSDGSLSIQEFLDQSAKYADEVADSIKNNPNTKLKNAPFTIAITDHDTLEGCKEAVKIIAQNPQKYKNLRLVLGTELTVENKMLGSDLKKPVQIHLVLNGLNPFDKKLNTYFESKKVARRNISKIFFDYSKKEISKINKNFAEELDFEEVKKENPTVRYGLSYPWYFIKNYVSKKMGKSTNINGNTDIQNEIINAFQKCIEKFSPKLDLEPHSMDMDEIINIMHKQKYGYMTYAHPALTEIGSFLKDPSISKDSMAKLFKLIKARGKDKFLAAEIYYPYYGACGESTEWLNLMAKCARENNIIAAGGLDSHGKNIFYSNK